MAEFIYDDFLNGSRNIGRGALFSYLRRIGVTVQMPNGSSHAKVVNAAGSTQILPMSTDDVGPGTLHGIHKFVDEHFIALAPRKEHVPASPVIHIDDDAAIEQAGLHVHALSQQARTVTLVDARYPEIAVQVQLHDDLAVTASHIKAAAAERDALVETYEHQLKELAQAHRIKRVMVHHRPQLHITSANSGRLRKDATPANLPTLDNSIDAAQLTEARNHAIAKVAAQAAALQGRESGKGTVQLQRPAEERAKVFATMQYELAQVGLHLSMQQQNGGKVAYVLSLGNLCGTHTDFVVAAERGLIENSSENMLRSYRKEGMSIRAGLEEMRERISGAGNMQFFINDVPVDDAPSEQALAELKKHITAYASKQILMSAKMARMSYDVKPVDHEGEPCYRLRPRIQNFVGKEQISLGVISHTPFSIKRHLLKDSTLGEAALNNLDAARIMRYMGGCGAYEELMIAALGAIGLYPVLRHAEDGSPRIAIVAEPKDTHELASFPVTIQKPQDIPAYLQKLGEVVRERYQLWGQAQLQARGWQMGECSDTAHQYTHAKYSPLQVSMPLFVPEAPNYREIKAAVNNGIQALDLAEHEQQEAELVASVKDSQLHAVNETITALRALGYCNHVNGSNRLLPPQAITQLNGLTYRDEAALLAKPHACNNYLNQLEGELKKAQAVLESQNAQIACFKEVFGDKLQLTAAGMTILVPNVKGDDIAREFAFAPTREGTPSPYFAPETLRAVAAMITPAEQRTRAERYALKASAGISR